MMNEEPVEVFASTHCYLPQIKELGDVDTILILLKFASGAMATIDLSRKSVYGYDQRVEIFGDKGMVQVENKPTTSVVISNENGQLHDNIMFSFPQRFEEAYFLELSHFVEVVLDKVPMRVTHTDCRNVYIIAETAKKSAELNQAIPLDYSQTKL
jgi:myo-inositol 2-dehydrogenase/D-chiro-inositol 1-dehydrogenase